MSKRRSHERGTFILPFAASALLILLVLGSSLEARSTNPSVSIVWPSFGTIGYHSYAQIVISNPPGQPSYGGFNLTLKFDPSALQFRSIQPGSWFNDCHWELYDYSVDQSRGVLHFQVAADLNNGNFHPTCFLAQPAETLGTLDFFVPNDSNFVCQAFPVEFYWDSCGANVFVSTDNQTVYVANEAFDLFNGGTPYPIPDTLHTVRGLPQQCLSGTIAGRNPVRLIDFHSGGIDVACRDYISARGDLNLNGIANEIADYIVFSNYFLYGLRSLDTNPDIRMSQIHASDVNADGRYMEFGDLVYLRRVIAGDTLPIALRPENGAAAANITQNLNAKTITVSYSGTLGGGAFFFSGDITPNSEIPYGNMVFSDSAGATRVVFVPDSSAGIAYGVSYGSGQWFSYTGDGILMSASTSDLKGKYITPVITYLGYTASCGDLNADMHSNISDAVYLIAYIFSSGPAPLDPRGGDVNCDGMTNISDAIYLVSYIFAGGPAPCQSCP